MPRKSKLDFTYREIQLINDEIQDETIDVESLKKEWKETCESQDYECLVFINELKNNLTQEKREFTQEELDKIEKDEETIDDYF
jgi:hypothetical protein